MQFGAQSLVKHRSSRRGLAAILAAAGITGAVVPLASSAVAAKGKGKGKGKSKDKKTRKLMIISDTDTVMTPAAPNCNSTGDQICTTVYTGTGNVRPLGEVTHISTYTADWSQAENHPDGGHCAPATGTIVLDVQGPKKKQGQVTLTMTGEVCDSPPNGGYPLTVDGTFKVSGGTRAYKGAKGKGTALGTAAGNNVGDLASIDAEGTIRY